MSRQSRFLKIICPSLSLTAIACSGSQESVFHNDHVGAKAVDPTIACTEDAQIRCEAGLTQACNTEKNVWGCAIEKDAPKSLAGKWFGKSGDTNGFFGSLEYEVAELVLTDNAKDDGFRFTATFDDGLNETNVSGWYTINFNKITFHYQSDRARGIPHDQVVTLDHFTKSEFVIRSLSEPELEVGKFERIVSDEQLDRLLGQ